jgi:hypothetical protein
VDTHTHTSINHSVCVSHVCVCLHLLTFDEVAAHCDCLHHFVTHYGDQNGHGTRIEPCSVWTGTDKQVKE